MQKVAINSLIFIGILVTFISISLASATCANNNQIILKLSSASNAHAEEHNGAGDYQVSICYNDIFGSAYSGVSNPWECAASNKILSLSSLSNAHAAADNSYTIPLCYGDLTCRVADSCNLVGEKMVLSLSSLSNAHAAADSSYPFKICCTRASAPASENCGNNIVDIGETCDDGNTNSGDGCSQLCILEPGCGITSQKWVVTGSGKDCGGKFTKVSGEHFKLTFDECNASSSYAAVDKNTILQGDFNLTIGFSDAGLKSFPILPNRKTDFFKFSGTFNASSSDNPYFGFIISTDDNGDSNFLVNTVSLILYGGYNQYPDAWLSAAKARNLTLAAAISPGTFVTIPANIIGVRIERAGDILNYYYVNPLNIETLFSSITNISTSNIFDITIGGSIWPTLNELNDSSVQEGYISPATTVDFSYSINPSSYNCNSQHICSLDGRYLLQYKGGSLAGNQSTENTAACAGPDGLTGGNFSNDDCCPNNLLCSTTGSKGCKIAPEFTSCSQITNETQCNSAPRQVYSRDTLYGRCGYNLSDSEGCPYKINCVRCKWNSSTSNCTLITENERINSDCPSSFWPTTCLHTLSFLGECSNGTMTRIVKDDAEVITLGTSNDSCVDRESQVACGTSALEAPFFSSINVLTTLVSIALIYVIYTQLKKRLK